jgi:hypothetical protein
MVGTLAPNLGVGAAARFYYVSGAGQATFTGADASPQALTLAYTPGYVEVSVDGIWQTPDEYTATNGSSIVFPVGLAAGRKVYVYCLSTFSIAGAVSFLVSQQLSALQKKQVQANVGFGKGYFSVNRNGVDQTGATAATFNKIQFTTEVVDSQNWFDNVTNFRFQPTESGYYFFSLFVRAAGNAESPQAQIRKIGSAALTGTYSPAGMGVGAACHTTASGIIFLNGSTDYVEAFVYLPATITTINSAVPEVHFEGWKVGE